MVILHLCAIYFICGFYKYWNKWISYFNHLYQVLSSMDYYYKIMCNGPLQISFNSIIVLFIKGTMKGSLWIAKSYIIYTFTKASLYNCQYVLKQYHYLDNTTLNPDIFCVQYALCHWFLHLSSHYMGQNTCTAMEFPDYLSQNKTLIIYNMCANSS